MPALTIRLKKHTDGSATLTCTRADGSTTWQRQRGAQAAFFPRHDLTHYAVETVLGHRRGFYGLLAEGWDLADFGAPWPKGRIPADAEPAELIVGFLDLERASGACWSAADLDEKLLAHHAMHGPFAAAEVGEDQLGAIRERRTELFARWDAIPVGETLSLAFEG